nr:MAG TPA: hypothetical protein [Herelleviridae sp.]
MINDICTVHSNPTFALVEIKKSSLKLLKGQYRPLSVQAAFLKCKPDASCLRFIVFIILVYILHQKAAYSQLCHTGKST